MPKVKKSVSSSDSDSGPEDKNPPPAKKGKSGDGAKEDAPTKWTLENKRYVCVNEFRGRKMVDIREYYEKDGKELPGKKGISLSINQWKRLRDIADEVTKAVEG